MANQSLGKSSMACGSTPEKNIVTETLDIEFFQELLGLKEDFFITCNWIKTEIEIKNAIKQTLRDNFKLINFEENQETSKVLESIGFDCHMATRLGEPFGPKIKDPNILWQKIQSFIQIRLDAIVASHPEWSKNEQTFNVFNSKENQEKQYQSILIPSKNPLNGNDESLKMLTDTALDDPSTTETWYHATTFREAEEIMKNGFRVKKCMANRNFSDGDGIYFTDSMTSAKQLFHHDAFTDHVVHPDIEFNKKNNQQYKIVVLAFTYHKEKNNLLENYKKHSIDLRDHATEERLKKIVSFFSKDPLPTRYPTIEEHGLHRDYVDTTEYIIGPHAIISGANEPLKNVYVNR